MIYTNTEKFGCSSNVKIIDPDTLPDTLLSPESLNDVNSKNTKANKYYTIYSFKLARKLLKNGCQIADLGLNKKIKGIVFHFYNTEKLRELIKCETEIVKLHKKMEEISKADE